MKKYIVRILFFGIVAFISVETFIRVKHLNIDVPTRQINEEGIQLYNPNQNGYWSNASHSWQINEEGWPGKLPHSRDSLITLIGDSHIENFMNPIECNLETILNEKKIRYNFFAAGRSGVSLIEALEISDYLKKYKPVKQFIFVKEGDLKESIQELGIKEDITQLSLKNKIIINGQLKSPGLKKIVYNIKTLYYYKNSLVGIRPGSSPKSKLTNSKEKHILNETDKIYYHQLLKYVFENYNTSEITFFLHPETTKSVEDIFKNNNLNYYKFITASPKKWRNSPQDESHWSCYGHQQAAIQVAAFLGEKEVVKK